MWLLLSVAPAWPDAPPSWPAGAGLCADAAQIVLDAPPTTEAALLDSLDRMRWTLAWPAATDDAPGVRYELARGGVVFATVGADAARQWEGDLKGGADLTVVAIDAAGQRSPPLVARAVGAERGALGGFGGGIEGGVLGAPGDGLGSGGIGSPPRASPPGPARPFPASEASSGAAEPPQTGAPPRLPSPDANKVASSNAREDAAVRSGSGSSARPHLRVSRVAGDGGPAVDPTALATPEMNACEARSRSFPSVGRVELVVAVAPSGTPTSVRVASSDDDGLAACAAAAARQWRFPAGAVAWSLTAHVEVGP